MSEYGIPYMGSKAGIAASLALNFPQAEHFYDLFGGGFSISHYMINHKSKRYKYFHYNEIKKDVTELVRKAINGEYNYNVFQPPWVSREDFFKYKDTDAYIRCLWSFGNNQEGYLFGVNIEEYKRAMHMAVVFNEFNDLAYAIFEFKEWPKDVNSITKKRLYLRQKIEWFRIKNKLPKILYQYLSDKHLKNMGNNDNYRQLQQLQRLEQLQQLQRLEQLQQLERLTITALDYRQVEILPNAIVYCDIPYKGTAGYGEFNHDEFFEWAATRTFPVYISEYHIADKRFECIYEVDKRVMLTQSGESNKIKLEKLYWNRVPLA